MEQVEVTTASIGSHFANLKDPRVNRRRLHKLVDILTIGVCTVICGGDDYPSMHAFGKAKEGWLRTFLELPNGIPSSDTFWRVFGAIDPEQFQECFLKWMTSVSTNTKGEIIAIDGKQLRCSHDKSKGKSAIHMVSAWATTNRMVLGQVKVDEKSNEITAIPELLSRLALHSCLVTLDAIGDQVDIAQKIVDGGGD